MIRASALYISLILSLMIVLICGSVLLIGYTYRLEQKKQERSQILERNLESATVMLLQEDFKPDTLEALSLFGTETDTVMLAKRGWGLYELASIRAWINTDTLSRVFLMAPQLSDTLRALYLSDEDRPLSISGKSLIKGTAYLPKSGIRASYVDGSTYTDKTLVYGTSKFSERTMPVLDQDILQTCNTMFDELARSDKKDPGLPADSVSNSFFQPLRKVFVQGSQADLSGRTLKGNLVIQCDTSLIVDASTILDQVILVAPHVLVKSGFKGNVQIFARDSITIADDVQLDYPSALLVLKADTAKFQIRIDIGKNCRISGQVIAYEKERSTLMPIISVGTGTVIQGELFSQGYLKFDRKTLVQGTVSAIRFMAKTSSSLYENYLIDTQINRRDLSRYYLGTKLLKGASTQNKILCWLK
jgi:hypothetical protein